MIQRWFVNLQGQTPFLSFFFHFSFIVERVGIIGADQLLSVKTALQVVFGC